MNRRTLLRTLGGSAVGLSSMVSGCLLSDSPASSGTVEGELWCYGVSGDLDAVADGTVYARERSAGERSGAEQRSRADPGADGEVVALDATSGDVEWTYGPSQSRQTGYRELLVENGVYATFCTDDPCTRLHSLDLDGEERWTREFGSRGWGGRPIVADGTVYIEQTPLHAVEEETGETLWTYPETSDESVTGLQADTSAVYVESDAAITALDPADGSERWQVDVGDRPGAGVLDSSIADGVLYVVTSDRVAAVADGELRWQWPTDAELHHEAEVVGLASNHLLVRAGEDGRRLHAFDVETGQRAWTLDSTENPERGERDRGGEEAELANRLDLAIHDDRVYATSDGLRALDAATGEERWRVATDGAPIWSVTVEDRAGGAHSAVARRGTRGLVEFSPDGERTWERTVDVTINDTLVGGQVFVGTDRQMCALDRQDSQ